MRAHKTGHPIADTVSDILGDLPDADYYIAYGILRHNLFDGPDAWFEIDKGFWGAGHFDGNYRLSYLGTQSRWRPDAPRKEHGLTLEPWIEPNRQRQHLTMILPPTPSVCDFFSIDYTSWLLEAAKGLKSYFIRHKGSTQRIQWEKIERVITFNSTLGVEALRRGIPVISDPNHSSIGSYTRAINCIDGYDRDPLYSFLDGHQFKLSDRESVWRLIDFYLQKNSRFSSGGIAAKQ